MIKSAVTYVVILIVILEILRKFRLLSRTAEDIQELKEKVANIEELLKNLNK